MASETAWRLDPDSQKLIYPAGREYTPSEFASEPRPACPVCGTEVVVDPADASHMHAREPVMHIPRGWRCPEGCAQGWAVPSQ